MAPIIAFAAETVHTRKLELLRGLIVKGCAIALIAAGAPFLTS